MMTLSDSENETHYENLKSLLKINYKKFTTEEARQMYDYALNYGIKKINSGKTIYLKEVFDLYKLLLQNKLIYEGEYISPWDYKNIVSVGLRLEKMDWTKRFIQKYKNNIAEKFRNNSYNFNLASYFFSKENYRYARKLLQNVELKDMFYHLSAKSMFLKIYYNLNDDKAFFSLSKTFNMYLKRNKKISEYQREVHTGLVRYSEKCFRFRTRIQKHKRNATKKEIASLQEQIRTTKNITNMQWLLEKVEELKNYEPNKKMKKY